MLFLVRKSKQHCHFIHCLTFKSPAFIHINMPMSNYSVLKSCKQNNRYKYLASNELQIIRINYKEKNTQSEI